METENDVTGLNFTVASNNNFSEGGIKLQEDEFYPAVLSDFKPFESTFNGIKTKQIRWVFELQGSEFTWKSKDGKTGQFRVSGATSYACSPKSKLYKWYCKLTGKEQLTEGEKISLNTLKGMHCSVMVKINKRKNSEGEEEVYNNVDKVKAGTSKVEVKTQPVVSPQVKVAPAVKVVEAAAIPTKSSGDLFEDVY